MIPRSCRGRPPSTIEARDSQDYPRDPRRDSAGEQADEVPDATPFAKADRTKKRRKAEGQDQDVDVERFSDLVLPSSQPGLERKVFYASMASSDEEGEEPEQEQTGGVVKGTRQEKISICSQWRLTRRQVAHTSRQRQFGCRFCSTASGDHDGSGVNSLEN